MEVRRIQGANSLAPNSSHDLAINMKSQNGLDQSKAFCFLGF